MLNLKRLWRVFLAKRREARKEIDRKVRWQAVRDRHLLLNHSCAACGSIENLQVHHAAPFCENPPLELIELSLVTLCEGEWECHQMLGHGGDWRFWNPCVFQDARAFEKAGPHERKRILARARAARVRDTDNDPFEFTSPPVMSAPFRPRSIRLSRA